MNPTVYGSNHIALEVTDAEAAAAFYQEVFGLERMREGEGQAFLRVGPHQFLAIFQVQEPHRDASRHFGIIVRDDDELTERRVDTIQKQVERRCARDVRCPHDAFLRGAGADVSSLPSAVHRCCAA